MSGEVVDRFVEVWGAMGTAWGISQSVARVHALLIASDRPWCLDEIAERLRISRGNASMSLKELRGWGVIRRVARPGDRREFWTSDDDPWQMLFSILRERKRREFDPVLGGVRAVRREAERAPGGVALERLRELEGMLGALEKLAGRALGEGSQVRALVTLLLGRS